MAITDRFKQAWKAFTNKDPTDYEMRYQGVSYSIKPDRPHFSRGVDKTIVTSFYTKVAVDCATTKLQHVQLDEEERFVAEIDSPLNDCFKYMANADQTGRDFLRDCVISLLDEGCVAIVPITTEQSPYYNDTFKIYEIRVAKILTWYPKAVRVKVYDEISGNFKEATFPKASVAIVENPFYSIMNEPNSVLQRLIHKLALIDSIDEKNASGKLDLIIQLPYVIKTESRMKQAEERRGQIETQLTGSKYGIAYIDGSEHITQLNRPVENNLMTQVEYYTKMFYNEMGITEELLNGSAKEEEKNEYFNHIIEPILTAITEAMTNKFLSQNARTRRQAIRFYRQPFKIVSVSSMAELADKFIRSEIMTGNEFRQIIGLKPSQQASADQLRNPNNLPDQASTEEGMVPEEGVNPLNDVNAMKQQLADLQNMDTQIDELEKLAQADSHEGQILVHSYKSPYYDPQKAHEYYEEHKELKGYENRYGGSRTSTAGLNEKGREVARIVKDRIDANKKYQNQLLRDESTKLKEKSKAEREEIVNQMKDELSNSIATLKSQLETMNPAQRKHAKIKIRAQIDKLKDEANELREALSEHYKQVNQELSESVKSGVEKNNYDANETYAAEIKKMLSDPSLVKPKKANQKKESSWKLYVERKNKS
ncbi:MAG: phage portal protein [Clostridiales bacterium]|nr:phage portal protein [Clostridiales bacterium]